MGKFLWGLFSSKSKTKRQISVYTGEKKSAMDQIKFYHDLLNNAKKAQEDALTKAAEEDKIIAENKEVLKGHEELELQFDRAERLKPEKIKLDAQERKYNTAYNEINAAVKRVAVQDDLMVDFLRLAQKLIPTIMQQDGKNKLLLSAIDSLYEVLNNDCSDNVVIEKYFNSKHRCLQAIDTFKNEEIVYCNHLEVDKETFDGEILPMIEGGITEAKNELQQLIDDEKKESEQRQDKLLKFKEELDPIETEYDTLKKQYFDLKKTKVDSGITEDDLAKDTDFQNAEKAFKDKKEIYDSKKQEYDDIKSENDLAEAEYIKKKKKLEINSKKLNFADKSFLKNTCYGSKKWQKIQSKRVEGNKEALDEFCPIMCKFFEAAYKSLKQSQDLLEASESGLTMLQKDAIKSYKPKAITNDTEKKEEEKKEEKEEKKEELTIDNIDIDNMDDINALVNNKELTAVVDNNATLIDIVITDLQIVESDDFKMIFVENIQARTFATSVQTACLEMMKCQGALRGQVLLAHEILRLKGASVDIDTNKYWHALDDGIIQILKSCSNIQTVSAKYFGFFVKFMQAFNKYTTNSRDISYLQDILRDFLEFKDTYETALAQLSGNAMKTIVNCVKQTIGDKNFEQAQSQIKALQEEYEKAQREYNLAVDRVNKEFIKIRSDIGECKGKIAQANTLKSFYKSAADEAKNTDQVKARLKDLESKVDKLTNYKLVDETIEEE